MTELSAVVSGSQMLVQRCVSVIILKSDFEKFVKGIENIYILQGSEEIDFDMRILSANIIRLDYRCKSKS